MKKVIIGVVIVALIALFGGRAWYLHKQAKDEKDVVKIGAVLPIFWCAMGDSNARPLVP